MKTHLKLGEIMVRRGFVTPQQVETALAYQKDHPELRIGQILETLGFAPQSQVMEALAERLDVPLVHMGQMEVDLGAVALIPQALAQKEMLLAVETTEQTLVVVTDDPLNYFALEEVRQLTGRELSVRLSETAPLRHAIAYYYAEVSARKATQSANRDFAPAEPREESESGDREAPIIKLLNSLIDRAISTRASDIHIEPYETETNVRMRIDGVIVDYVTLQKTIHQPVIARIKIMANLNIAERRLPQDGHFRLRVGGEPINIRVSILPTVFGEKAVLRLLAVSGQVEDHAHRFGMSEAVYRRFLPMLSAPNGIIYITGPTGSGKSTTLYMILEHLAQRPVNISTIEDPVEKNIRRVNQTQVNTAAGLTFEGGLRALLRQDPDIIMVGETRDGETASISVRAAITGHMVLSTLHTNNALSSIVRLTDMGVEPYLLANSLVGLVAQRLVRKVCPECGTEVETTAEERAFLGADIKTIRRGSGCQHCSGTGYRGRIALHEIVSIDRELRRMIAAGADTQTMEAYARTAQGMRSLKEQGVDLVRQGVTTPEELLRIASWE